MAKSKKKGGALKWVLIVVVIIVILVFVFKKANATPSETSPSSTVSSLDRSKVLEMGSEGQEVKALQRKLNDEGASLYVDGIFGSKTQAALKTHFNQTTATLNEIGA